MSVVAKLYCRDGVTRCQGISQIEQFLSPFLGRRKPTPWLSLPATAGLATEIHILDLKTL
jgi:hypothetical protein